ncbi:MAG: carbon-nitrogen hydrolase family protein, partial [Pirellulaceae bacterium]
QYLDMFIDMAVKYNVNIIGGSQFVIENDTLYNIGYLFRRDGSIGKQYKIHITPSERKWWGVNPGSRVEVFDTDCGPIAIQICYDIEFPELTRIAASKGAQLVFVPFNTDTRHGYLRVRHCALARCVENHMYVAIAGCTGNLPSVENSDIHYAQSGIFTPADIEFARDAIAAECNPNIETVIIHDLDFEQLRRHREAGSVQNWNDRRRDIYRVLYDEDGTAHNI